MYKKIATALLCTVAPVGLLAEDVELRSADGFISVDGEIISFNGVMLSVRTSIGVVSVPAAEVACYGAACLTALSDPDLGIPPDTFTEVVVQGDTTTASTTGQGAVASEPAEVVAPREDNLLVNFAQSGYGDLFRALAGSFALDNAGDSRLGLARPGEIDMANETRRETAKVLISETGTDSDIAVDMVPLTGAAGFEYQSPADWSLTGPVTYQLLGLDAFAVITAPNAGISTITLEQLAGIFAGEITNWADLGGTDMRILPLQLPITSPQRDEFLRLVMVPAGKDIAANVLTLEDEARIAASINQFAGSIGVVSLSNVDTDAVMPVSGSCGLGTSPTPFNIVSGDYPLIRPVMASFDTPPQTALMTELFDFASNAISQRAIANEGYVDRTPVAQNGDESNDRIATILGTDLSDANKLAGASAFEVLFDAQRLTPTIIGGAVSGPEGAWNRAMFTALVEQLSDSSFAGRDIYFVGFADSQNGDDAAINVSARTARDTQAAFGQFARDVIGQNNLNLSSYGFGSVAQATCYHGQVAADTTSRVEIWVK